MAPDLNSLPPSRSTSSSPMQSRVVFPATPETLRRQTPSPSPRSSSVSLAAAATINAADISRRSSITSNARGSPAGGRASERRRSVAMNLNLNDPSLPGPGELSSSDHRSSIGHAFRNASPTSIGGSPTIATGDPHHQRAPSLGEMHQELEQEQEAQVNRLLQMIRTQQTQLQQLQAQQSNPPGSTSTLAQQSSALDDSTPTSERSFSLQTTFPALPTPIPQTARPLHRGPSSQTTSPALRPLPSVPSGLTLDSTSPAAEAFPLLSGDSSRRSGSRDESAFYQAETQTLTRENQMLRLRIRELERQISGLSSSPANTPATPSNLATSPPEGLGIGAPIAATADNEADKTRSQP